MTIDVLINFKKTFDILILFKFLINFWTVFDFQHSFWYSDFRLSDQLVIFSHFWHSDPLTNFWLSMFWSILKRLSKFWSFSNFWSTFRLLTFWPFPHLTRKDNSCTNWILTTRCFEEFHLIWQFLTFKISNCCVCTFRHWHFLCNK